MCNFYLQWPHYSNGGRELELLHCSTSVAQEELQQKDFKHLCYYHVAQSCFQVNQQRVVEFIKRISPFAL